MEKMTRPEMIEFLKGINQRQKFLDEEKRLVKGSVETLEEAIQRNSFAKNPDESGIISGGFSPDKVFHVLLNSERDIEEETRSMVCRMRDLYEMEDQIDFVRTCILQIPAKEQFLINEFYIKDSVIEVLSTQTNLSPSYLYRKLKSALERLLTVYNSGCEQARSIKAERLIREVIPYMPEGSIA